MTRQIPIFIIITINTLFCQHLPLEWSQAYSTYDIAGVHDPGEYSLGFAINNYALYSSSSDSIAYDTRRFDIFARIGVLKNIEFEMKFSSPTSGVIAGKYRFWSGFLDAAIKFGFGYMKGTRVNFITDYLFDFYPTLLFTKKISEKVKIYYAPRIIYSIYPRDRQEHSTREPRYIVQFGHGIGIAFGDDFVLMPEGNWFFGDNEGIDYTVNQFGLGVNLRLH
ncbi:MAG: hypothetical protein WBB37_04335 [bacterium]